jgi:hypothetical protein
MSRPLARALAVFLALLLPGCSLVQPFDTAGRPVPNDVSEEGERVGVCYNAVFTKPERIREIAAETCGPGTTPNLVNQDMRLACPVLTPVRATFVCTPE